MSRSAINQLRDANPHPRTLPAPPIETVLGRLGERPGTAQRRLALAPPALGRAGDAADHDRGRGWRARPGADQRALRSCGAQRRSQRCYRGWAADRRHARGARGCAPSRDARDGVLPRLRLRWLPTAAGSSHSSSASGARATGIKRLTHASSIGSSRRTRAGSGTLTRTRLSAHVSAALGPERLGIRRPIQWPREGRHRRVLCQPRPRPPLVGGTVRRPQRRQSAGVARIWRGVVSRPAPRSDGRAARTSFRQPPARHRRAADARHVGERAGRRCRTRHGVPVHRQHGGPMYQTRDDGRSWQPVTPPCPAGELGRLANGASGNAVWVVCARLLKAPVPRNAHLTLARSTDGGRHWADLPTPFSAGVTPILSPVSPSVIWAQNGSGAVLRSTNAGATWQTVWSLAQQAPRLRSHHLPGTYPGDLIAQNPQNATMQLSLVHGRPGSSAAYTNLVRYRTTDGGRTWKTKVISLAVR